LILGGKEEREKVGSALELERKKTNEIQKKKGRFGEKKRGGDHDFTPREKGGGEKVKMRFISNCGKEKKV